MALNEKQARFIVEYLVDLNASGAARRAGYSEKTAYSMGHELLKKPEIAEAIQAAKDERAQRTEITVDRVLQELAAIAFANTRDVVKWGVKEVAFGFDDEGRRLPAEKIGDATVVQYIPSPFADPVNAEDLTPALAAAVKKVGLGQNGFTIEMHDKMAALARLGEHLGMKAPSKLEVSGPGGAPMQMDDLSAAARLAAILDAARSRRDAE